MEKKPGTYVLLLQSDRSAQISVGKWGEITLKPGFYFYVGSAFGPGGVQARVLRHCRKNKAKHWHIDYLQNHVRPLGAWYSHDAKRLEHHWAQTFLALETASAIKDFGCSDCRCESHLFYSATSPNFAKFCSLSGSGLQQWHFDETAGTNRS